MQKIAAAQRLHTPSALLICASTPDLQSPVNLLNHLNLNPHMTPAHSSSATPEAKQGISIPVSRQASTAAQRLHTPSALLICAPTPDPLNPVNHLNHLNLSPHMTPAHSSSTPPEAKQGISIPVSRQASTAAQRLHTPSALLICAPTPDPLSPVNLLNHLNLSPHMTPAHSSDQSSSATPEAKQGISIPVSRQTAIAAQRLHTPSALFICAPTPDPLNPVNLLNLLNLCPHMIPTHGSEMTQGYLAYPSIIFFTLLRMSAFSLSATVVSTGCDTLAFFTTGTFSAPSGRGFFSTPTTWRLFFCLA